MNAREALHYLAAFPSPEDRSTAVATLSAALDERDALREALEPFNWDDSEIASYAWCPDDKIIGEVSAGDIRRAHAALAGDTSSKGAKHE